MDNNSAHAHTADELRRLTEGAYLLLVAIGERRDELDEENWGRWRDQQHRYVDVCRLCFLDALVWIAEGVLEHGVEPEQALRDQIKSRLNGAGTERWAFATSEIAAEFFPEPPVYPPPKH